MKLGKIALIISIMLVAVVAIGNTVYAVTKSATLVAASSQSFEAADSASLSQTGDQTHDGWWKFTTTPSSGNGMNMFSKYVGASGRRGISLVYENSGGTLMFHARTSADGNSVSEGTLNYTLSTGTWYYIRFVYRASAGAMDIYVDDLTTPVGTITGLTTSIKDNDAFYRLGANTDITGNLNGQMSVMRVWSTQHTTNDKCVVYGTATTGMQAEWSLDNVLTDASGNGNTLTNNNSATFTTDIPACASPSVPSTIDSFIFFE